MRGLETKEGVPGVHCITSFIPSRLTIERRCGPERILSIPPTAIGLGWSFILMWVIPTTGGRLLGAT